MKCSSDCRCQERGIDDCVPPGAVPLAARNEHLGRTSATVVAKRQHMHIALQQCGGQKVAIFQVLFFTHAQQAQQCILPCAVAQEFIAVTLELIDNDIDLSLRKTDFHIGNGRKHDHRSDNGRKQAVNLTVMEHFLRVF